MLLVPSPHSIIHQRHYKKKINDHQTLDNQISTDINNDFQNISSVNQIFSRLWQVDLSLSLNNKERCYNIYLLLALFSKKHQLFHTSKFFLKKAVDHGSLEAISLLGSYYLNNTKKSLFWHKRFYRSNPQLLSIDIIKSFIRSGQYLQALHFIPRSTLFIFDNTINSRRALLVSNIFYLLNDPIHIRWYRYCAICGYKKALIYMQKLNPDIWDKYSPTFESVDYSLIRLSPPAVLDDYSEVNQLSESFCIKHEQQQLSYDSSIQLQFRPNIAQSIDECYITPLCVQNNTKSLLLIKIFTTASPNLRERNLQLCNIFIHQLYDKSPRDILSNILFKNKCTCGTESDLIRCGFIAFLVGDYDMSVNIFYRALAKGSETASTMIGIILFYLYQKKKRALMFFSRAATNPLALAHLALVFSDNETYLLRLKDIVDEENEGLIYEKIGDAFWDGVLVPRNKVIAKLFYGVALDNYDKNFKDETNIIEKISRPIE